MSVTFDEGGRGRKKCGCGVYVPARCSLCPKCGRVFVSRIAEEQSRLARQKEQRTAAAPAVEAESAPVEKAERGDGREILLVPSGACPVTLSGTELAEVQAWSALVCDAVPLRVSRAAALQYARQFFPPHTEGYRAVREHLKRCSRLCEPS